MIEVVLFAWFAVAALAAGGFHLARRHWQRIGEEAVVRRFGRDEYGYPYDYENEAK